MNFRNTYITDYIYQASPEVLDANPVLRKVFKEYCTTVSQSVDERGYGYFAGVIGTSDGSIDEVNFNYFVYDLEHATKVPFRLTVMFEAGPVITYNIEPRV